MKVSTIVSLVLITTGCNQVSETATSTSNGIDTESELEAIEILRDKFELAIKEGRYDDIKQLVSSDVKTIGAGGEGWNQMRKLGKERGRFPYDSIIMRPTETMLLSDSMAYDWGTSSVYYTSEDGMQMELQDSFLVLLKKEGGEWKLHREVASSVVE